MRCYGFEIYIAKLGRTRLGDSACIGGNPRSLLNFFTRSLVNSPANRFQCLAGNIWKSDNESRQFGGPSQPMRAQLDRDVDCDYRLLNPYPIGHLCLASSTICARDNSHYDRGIFFLGNFYTVGMNTDV